MDPVEGNLLDPQSLNRYAYSRNNPLRFVDPTGESFSDRINELGKSYSDLYSRTGALAVGIPVFLVKNPIEAGKIGITLLPVAGEAIDSYEISTGKDFFDGSSISGERRAMTVAGLASGFGSGRFARMADEFGDDGKDIQKSLDEFPDDAIVVRGGGPDNFTPKAIEKSIRPSRIPGIVGFSAQCNGCTDLEKSLRNFGQHLKNKELGVVKAGDLRKAGGNPISTPGWGAHVTVTNLKGEPASKVPWKYYKNPNPKR